MEKIKLYKASSFKYTPFENFVDNDLSFLNDNDIVIVGNVNEADIIISQNLKHLRKFFWRFIQGKKFLIWTLEPRFNTSFSKIKKYFFGFLKVHIMNIYTRDVFITNLTFHAGIINKKLYKIDQVDLGERKIIALMSYYQGLKTPKFLREGENIDLIGLRSKIAITGAKLGVLDIYGRGWPDNLSKEDSRNGDWVSRKKKLVAPYKFNLCFENTATFNYMTEKIWDSIENYCLPIYYAKNTNSYELFPKNSFIDYSDFNNPLELFRFIEQMTSEEYLDRINKCIDVFNSISVQSESLSLIERKKMLDRIVQKVNYIYSIK